MSKNMVDKSVNRDGTGSPDLVEDTYVSILMALRGAKEIGDTTLEYLLRMSLEQLHARNIHPSGIEAKGCE